MRLFLNATDTIYWAGVQSRIRAEAHKLGGFGERQDSFDLDGQRGSSPAPEKVTALRAHWMGHGAP
jgi:hypothetical protein